MYAPAQPRRRGRGARRATIATVWVVAGGNAAAIVWLWYHGGNVTGVHSTGELLTSIGRITGLLGAYLALLQVLLLARIPALERRVGLRPADGLAPLERARMPLPDPCARRLLGARICPNGSPPVRKEISTMIWGGIYPGMITATVGTALFIAVVVSSIVIVRARLRYETWYLVHLTVYAAIALSWFHEIPTGNELVLDRTAQYYWNGLYLATLAVLVVFRLGEPALNAFLYRLRVIEVVPEGPGVVSLRIAGRNLDRLHAKRRDSSFSGASSAGTTGGDPIRSRSQRRRTAAHFGSPSRASATSRAGSAISHPARA